ncbi:hypothetical protein Dimus_032409 [Dionaea muscipula]
MESTASATPMIPFKSKKRVTNALKKSDQIPVIPKQSNMNHFPASKTPEKLDPPSSRARNKNAAFSISDIRRAALKLQKSNLSRSDLVTGEPDSCSDLGIKELPGTRPSVKPKNSVRLPEKYEMLCEFFNAMVSSIQLLRLKKSSPTLINLSPKIESLTDRRFTIKHLAQLKHILPEVILTKRIRVQDEETRCMKEDLHITLDVDALKTNENEKPVNGPSLLKKVFRSRISEYYETHPEVDEIPEATMPGLFYPPKQAPDDTSEVSSMASSHHPPSFKKRFSSKTSSLEEEGNTNVLEISTRCLGEDKTAILESKSIEFTESPPLSVIATPRKEMHTHSAEVSLSSKGASSTCKTPARLVSTPARLMAATPLKSDKRCYMSPDDNSYASPNKLLRRSDRIKSLKFGPPEDDASTTIEDHTSQLQGSAIDNELDFLPQSLLQSVREEEKKMLEEQDPAISQAKRRQRVMARLPQLFDMIHLLFQSINRSVITKEEFMYKIIVGHREIIDKHEVEEQLKLLKELAPEYISEQLCLSGSTLIHFNKYSSAESIRAKLLEAK